jgi:predicted nuclease of predicted toxin-antitoxin system
MRFLLDANLPARLAQAFTDAGHFCEHMEDLMPRYSPDTEIARIANDSGAVLVSRDADFVQLSRDGKLTVQLIWVRLGNLRRAALASAIVARMPAIVAAIEAGDAIIELR